MARAESEISGGSAGRVRENAAMNDGITKIAIYCNVSMSNSLKVIHSIHLYTSLSSPKEYSILKNTHQANCHVL